MSDEVRFVQKKFKCRNCGLRFKRLVPFDDQTTKCGRCADGEAIIDDGVQTNNTRNAENEDRGTNRNGNTHSNINTNANANSNANGNTTTETNSSTRTNSTKQQQQ